MKRNEKIFVAGHRGLAGSALVRALHRDGFENLVLRSHAEMDLTQQAAVEEFFAQERPRHVLLAAAKVGGILANATLPFDFVSTNLAIQTNVIGAAHRFGVERLLFLGSSCIYPRECPQPIREEYLLTGPLEPTNRPYALAKIAGIEMCWACNRQFGKHFLAVMPTNLFGPGDNYDLQGSHVIPALIRKMHEAKVGGMSECVVWGTGEPRREFLLSDDMAEACLFLMQLPDSEYLPLVCGDKQPPLINIGCGSDITIRELAQQIADVVCYKGKLVFDPAKPDGTPRRMLDVSRLKSLGWNAPTSLPTALQLTYDSFLREYPYRATTR
jgi:GDP-L-fucose synthase